MTINDKLAKYVLNSLVESEEYSKNVKLPSGKPSASGRSKPKSAISTIKSSDDEEVDEEDLEEQQKMGKKARQNARRDYQTDREEMRQGMGWQERAENRKGHRRLSGMLRGAMERMKKRNAREDSSTNWQDRMVDILADKINEARGDAIQKLGIPLTHITGSDGPVVPPRGHRVAKRLAGRAKEKRARDKELATRPPTPNYVRPTRRSMGDNTYRGDSD